MSKVAVGQRLAEARGGMTQEEFAALIGVHPNTQGRYERGDRLPDTEYLNAASAKADLNPIWVLRGEGSRSFLQSAGGDPDPSWSRRGVSFSAREPRPRYDLGSDEFVFLPHYDARAAAGHGALVDDKPSSRRWAFERAWLAKEVGVAPDRLFLINVAGDSVPELHDGDVVMVDRGDIERVRGLIYVFVLDGHLYIKHLVMEGETLVITSRHGTQRVQMRDNPSLRIIGRVLGRPRFDRL